MSSAAAGLASRSFLVQDRRALEVVLYRQEERVVLGELLERALRLVVELLVASHLVQEALHLAVPRHRCHAEEDPLRLVVLRDRLERLHVVQPQSEHATVERAGRPTGYGYF